LPIRQAVQPITTASARRSNNVVRLVGWDLYGVLVDPPPWADPTMLHVVWENDDYMCVYAPEELEYVSEINDQNAAAVARQAGDQEISPSVMQEFGT
jgi:hypothetical protein